MLYSESAYCVDVTLIFMISSKNPGPRASGTPISNYEYTYIYIYIIIIIILIIIVIIIMII